MIRKQVYFRSLFEKRTDNPIALPSKGGTDISIVLSNSGYDTIKMVYDCQKP